MIGWLVGILVYAVAVFLVAQVLPSVQIRSFGTAVVVSLVYGILHKLLFGLLVFLTLPFVILTGFLFLFVLNALLLWVTNQMVDGFTIRGGAMNILLTSLAFSVVSLLLSRLVF